MADNDTLQQSNPPTADPVPAAEPQAITITKDLDPTTWRPFIVKKNGLTVGRYATVEGARKNARRFK